MIIKGLGINFYTFNMRVLRYIADAMPIITIPIGVGDAVYYIRLFDNRVFVEDLRKEK